MSSRKLATSLISRSCCRAKSSRLTGSSAISSSDPPANLGRRAARVKQRVPLATAKGVGARRILEKAVDQRPAAQQRVLLLGLPVQLDIAVGQIEDMANVVRRQPLDAEEVPVPEAVFLHEFPL